MLPEITVEGIVDSVRRTYIFFLVRPVVDLDLRRQFEIAYATSNIIIVSIEKLAAAAIEVFRSAA